MNTWVLAVLLLWPVALSVAQNRLPPSSQKILFEVTSRIADIDSSLPVQRYSLAQRRSLLRQLYQIDQRYRDSLENGSQWPSKQELFTHKMVANDQANQVLLGKLVDCFGWPTRRAYGEQGPLTAWLIVWHAKPRYQQRYFPLMKRAYQRALRQQKSNQLNKPLKRYPRG